MCPKNGFMDDWFGVDTPAAPTPTPAPAVKVFSQQNNPSAAATQNDLSPDAEGTVAKRKKTGRSMLKIDRGGAQAGSSGLNLPQG